MRSQAGTDERSPPTSVIPPSAVAGPTKTSPMKNTGTDAAPQAYFPFSRRSPYAIGWAGFLTPDPHRSAPSRLPSGDLVERLPVTVAGPCRLCSVPRTDAAHRTSLLLPMAGSTHPTRYEVWDKYRDASGERQGEQRIGVKLPGNTPHPSRENRWTSEYLALRAIHQTRR